MLSGETRIKRKKITFRTKVWAGGDAETFGHIVVQTTYTSHIDHLTPQHTAFEQSPACLSVFLGLLPGLIPLTMLCHAG